MDEGVPLREVLTLPALDRARVVGGSGGLELGLAVRLMRLGRGGTRR